MPKSKVTDETRKYKQETIAILFGKSAGHCTICNRPLHYDYFSHTDVNTSEKAHIKAFSDLGPRADKTLSYKERNDYNNLILLCGLCHSTIDKKISEEIYTVDWLRNQKLKKEKEVLEIMKCLTPKNLYCIKLLSPIADSNFDYDDNTLLKICFKNGFHVNDTIIDLSVNLGTENNMLGGPVLDHQISTKFKLLNNDGSNNEFCIFALGPQYLLIKLGHELSDKADAHIFTKHRDGWIYDEQTECKNTFTAVAPTKINKNNQVALVISSTAEICKERIFLSLGKKTDIWELKASKIGIDNISSIDELSQFAIQCTTMLDEIGKAYGKDKLINVFPAMCNSLAIKFGQSIFHKSHNAITIFDSQKDKNGLQIDKKILTI